EKMLPVEFESPALESPQDAIAEKPVRLELTSAGRANPMLKLADKDEENIALWKQLPPLYWIAKVSRPKPAAEVLLVDPDPARLYGAGFEPVQEPAIKGFYGLKNSQGQRPEVTLRAIPEQPGLYRAEFVAPAPGNYQFWVEQDANTLLDFNVTEPRFELGETAMNEPLLKEIASTTGGAFFREEDLYKLPDMISAKTERVRSPLEVELWAS